jgi:hypothetical protein
MYTTIMGGGLIQLVAYGAQDVYLTGNPQITFFKSVYRRHTNFSMENIDLPITNADFGKKAYVIVTRNGDLITKIYLRIVLPSISIADSLADSVAFAWVRKIGNAILDNYYIEIGGAQIDKQYGNWLNLWHELSSDFNQERGYNKLIGDVPELTRLEKARTDGSDIIKDEYHLYIPLMLWFCRNYGLALPLIALQYHEVRLNFYFRQFSECIVYTKNAPQSDRTFIRGSSSSGFDSSVLIDYIYLDSDERRRFAQVGHEYLIDQLQFTNEVAVTSGTITQQLFFNHPVKFLNWALKMGAFQGNSFLAYSNTQDWNTALEIAAQSVALGRLLLDPSNGNAPVYSPSNAPNTPTVYAYNSNSNSLGVPAGALPVNTTGYTAYPVSFVAPGQPPVAGAPLFVWVLNTGANNTATGGVLTPKAGSVSTDDLALKVLLNNYSFLLTTVGINVVTLNLGQANLVANNLTIQDISKPLENFNDNRNSVVMQTDVLVWQHHNHGLLINESVNPVVAGNIKLNGHDRFNVRNGNYFNYIQPWQHFYRTPEDGNNVYSFAIKPIDHQPSGTCNFSRIDTAQLNLWFENNGQKNNQVLNRAIFLGIIPGLSNAVPNTNLFIYAVNYNVLRIMSGMGGLAYSS